MSMFQPWWRGAAPARSIARPLQTPVMLACLLGGGATAAPLSATAQPDEEPLPEVKVIAPLNRPAGNAISDDIAAAPAAVTVISKQELDRKTITSYGDIFRGIGGISLMQYGQGLVAYEIKARGFSSGHGRDFAFFLDGMPLNVTASQHTNGYADLAQLIPELLSRVEVVRGPFTAFVGNHAVAGSVQLYTDTAAKPLFKLTVDNFGQSRAVSVLGKQLGSGNLLLAADGTQGDGYTEESEISRLNLFGRYLFPLWDGYAALRVQSYRGEAEAPGYLDLAKVRSGAISEKDALSKGIGDKKDQHNLVFNYRSDDSQGTQPGWSGGWMAVAYFNKDSRYRYTNFNLSTPVNSSVNLGGENDRLNQFGFDLRKTLQLDLGKLPAQLALGAQYDGERVKGQHFTTDAARNPLSGSGDTVQVDRQVDVDTEALYAQYQLQLLQRLKLTAGLRYDRLVFDLNLHPQDDTYTAAAAAGVADFSTSVSQFSPKLGAAYSLLSSDSSQYAELYANAARGLKSPYPFSDYYSNLGSSNSLPDLKISPLLSYEAGLQGNAVDGSLSWRLSYWDTEQSKEADVNAVGIYQSFKKTERRGFDLEAAVNLSKALRLFGNYSRVHARVKDPVTVGADQVPNVPDYTATLGLEAVLISGEHHLDVSLADTLTGSQPLSADNSLRSGSYNRTTARLAYSRNEWQGSNVFLSLVHYDKPLNEVQFDFGGGAIGTSPRPRLQAIAGLQLQW